MKNIIKITALFILSSIIGLFFIHTAKTKQHIFHSYGRDPTIIYPLTKKQFIKIENKFQHINRQYYANTDIQFMHEEIAYFIQDKKKEYTTKEKNKLKKIKKDIMYFETLFDTQYAIFYPKRGLGDHKICIYNAKQEKGYCIMQHM